jgi:hypothetical protein
MITVTATMTRPNTDSPWFLAADPAMSAILVNLKSEPEVLSSSSSISFDGLTSTGILEFNSYDTYYAWTEKLRTADPLFLVKRNDYIVNNGHTLKIEESLDNGPAIVEKLV